MMRKKGFCFTTILCVFALISSCTDLPDIEKEKPTPEEPTPGETIDFDWKIAEGLTLEVKVKTLEGKANNYYRTVKVYTDESLDNTALIATGAARPGEPYQTEISVPSAVKSLFIQVKDASSKSATYKCDIVSKQGSLVLDTNNAPTYDLVTRSGRLTAASPGITLPASYDYTITTEFPGKLEDGKTYYIPKGVTIELDDPAVFNNGTYTKVPTATIYVAGTLKMKETSSNRIASKHFVVLPGGYIEATRFYFIKMADKETPVIHVMEGGKINASEIYIQENLTMIINGIVTCDEFGTYKNTEIHIGGLLKVRKKLNLGWPWENYVYMYPNSVIDVLGSAWVGWATITMYEDAIFYSATNTPSKEAKFIAPDGNKAFVRIDGENYTYGQTYTFDGDIEVFIPNLKSGHRQNMLDRMSNGAFLTDSWEGRQYYIAWTEINNGYGEFEFTDKDGDGIPAHEDIDDNDPNVAYNSYFPSAGDMATMMFEDNWPGRGDYDMNDIVVDFNVYWATNAQNLVTDMTIQWKLRAAGAQNKLAMALQLDGLALNDVAYINSTLPLSGNIPFIVDAKGLELMQSHPVIPLFNDVGDIFRGTNKMVNTYQGQAYLEPNTETLTIQFTSPVAMRHVSETKLNFFIVASSHDKPSRDREIHFPWLKRTDLGKLVTSENTHPDNEYMTVDGMMWGIMIPKSIKYPLEGVNMEDAYTKFKSWYESNGENNANWYEEHSGNIDESKVYQVPVLEEEITE